MNKLYPEKWEIKLSTGNYSRNFTISKDSKNERYAVYTDTLKIDDGKVFCGMCNDIRTAVEGIQKIYPTKCKNCGTYTLSYIGKCPKCGKHEFITED